MAERRWIESLRKPEPKRVPSRYQEKMQKTSLETSDTLRIQSCFKDDTICKRDSRIKDLEYLIAEQRRVRCHECDAMRRQMAISADVFVSRQKSTIQRYEAMQASIQDLFEVLNSYPEINYQQIFYNNEALYKWIFGKQDEWMAFQQKKHSPVTSLMNALWEQISKPLDTASITEKLLEKEQNDKDQLLDENERLQERLDKISESESETQKARTIEWQQKCASLDQERQSLQRSLNEQKQRLTASENMLDKKQRECEQVMENKQELINYTDEMVKAYVKSKYQLTQIHETVFRRPMDCDEWSDTDLRLLEVKMSEAREMESKFAVELEFQKENFRKQQQKLADDFNAELKTVVLEKNHAINRCTELEAKVHQATYVNDLLIKENAEMKETLHNFERRLDDAQAQAEISYSKIKGENLGLHASLLTETRQVDELQQQLSSMKQCVNELEQKNKLEKTGVHTHEHHLKNKEKEIEDLKRGYDDAINKIKQLENDDTSQKANLQIIMSNFEQLQNVNGMLTHHVEEKARENARLAAEIKAKEQHIKHVTEHMDDLRHEKEEQKISLEKYMNECRRLKSALEMSGQQQSRMISDDKLKSVTREKEKMKTRILKLENDLDHARQEMYQINAQHQDAITKVKEQLASKTVLQVQLQTNLEKCQANENKLLKRLNTEEIEKGQIVKQRDNLQVKMGNKKNMLAKQEEKIGILQTALGDAKQQQASMMSRDDKLKQLTIENEDLRHRLQVDIDAKTREMEQLANERDRLFETVQKQQLECHALTEELQKTKDSIAGEVQILMREKEDIHQRNTDLRTKLSQEKQNFSNLEEGYHNMQAANKSLKEKLKEQGMNSQALSDRHATQLENKSTRIRELQTEIRQLKVQRSEDSERQTEAHQILTASTAEVENMRQEIETLKIKIEDVTQKLTSMKSENHRLSEKVSQLKTTLSSAKKEREDFQGLLHAEERKNQELQQKLEKLNSKLSQTERKNMQEIHRLQSELSETEGQSEQQLTALEKQHESLLEANRKLQKGKEDLEKRLVTGHNKDMEEKEEIVHQVEDEKHALAEELVQCQKELKKAGTHSKKLQEVIEQLRQSQTRIEAEKCELQAHKLNLEQEHQRHTKDIEEKDKEIENLGESLYSLQQDLKREADVVSEERAAYSSLQAELKQCKRKAVSDHDHLQREIRERDASIVGLKQRYESQLQEQERNIQKLSAERDSLIEQHKSETKRLKTEIKQLKQGEETNNSRTKELEMSLQKKETEIIQQRKRHTKEIKEKDKEIENIVSDTDHLQRKVKERDASIVGLKQRYESQLKEQEGIIQKLSAERDSLIEQHKSETKRLTTKIKQLKQAEDANDSRINELEMLLQEKEREITLQRKGHTKEIKEKHKEINDLGDRLNSLQQESDDVSEARADYSRLQAELKQCKRKAVSDTDYLQREIKERDASIVGLKQSHRKEIEDKENEVHKLKKEKDLLEKEWQRLSNLSDDQDSLRNLVDDRERELTSLSSEHDQLKQRLSDAKNELSRLQPKLQQLKTEKENLMHVIKQKDVKIKDLSQAIEKKDANIKDLTHSHRKEIEDKENEVHKLKKEKDLLEKEWQRLSNLSDDQDSLRNLVDDRERELTSLSSEHDQLKQRLSDAKNELSRLQPKLQQLKTEKENLMHVIKQKDVKIKDLSQAIEKKDANIKDLTHRLSSEMGAKVGSDESSLENISIKNRPMNIATDYDLLCSNEWLAAKSDLDDNCPGMTDDEKIHLLCEVLIMSVTEGTNLKKVLLQSLSAQSFQPGMSVNPDTTAVRKTFKDHLVNNLMDFLRETADEADLTRLSQTVEKLIAKKFKAIRSHLSSDGVDSYLKATALVAWKMVLQRPPMTLEQSGLGESWQGDKKQEVFWSSSDPSNPKSKVKYYVHPALYHGEALMIKGRVYLSIE